MKILTSFFLSIFLFTNQIYAKYNYKIVFDAFSLKRDNSEIVYQIEKSISDDVYTNKDVVLRIVSNKKIEPVEGFELDEAKTTLTKIITQNEEKTFVLEDISGNKKEVSYLVSNIDKEPPQIIGIEDKKVYNQQMSIQYSDNIGIKEISAEKYHDVLAIKCVDTYHNTGDFYQGIDVLGNSIYIDVVKRPKGTKAYKFYLNNELKATTDVSEYKYEGLQMATTYVVKVEAIDENGEVLGTVSRTQKTKCFTNLIARKQGDNFYVTITGIHNKANVGFCALWYQNCGTQKTTYPSIKSDRSISLSFNAYEITGQKSTTAYYYFHLQLYNYSDERFNEIISMNIKFDGKTFVKESEIVDPNNLKENGNYEITAIDLAGNKTTKTCTISL